MFVISLYNILFDSKMRFFPHLTSRGGKSCFLHLPPSLPLMYPLPSPPQSQASTLSHLPPAQPAYLCRAPSLLQPAVRSMAPSLPHTSGAGSMRLLQGHAGAMLCVSGCSRDRSCCHWARVRGGGVEALRGKGAGDLRLWGGLCFKGISVGWTGIREQASFPPAPLLPPRCLFPNHVYTTALLTASPAACPTVCIPHCLSPHYPAHCLLLYCLPIPPITCLPSLPAAMVG